MRHQTITKQPIHLKKNVVLFLHLLLFIAISINTPIYAQDSVHISLKQTLIQGLQNSKTLQLSQAKIKEAFSRFKQTKDARLPNILVSFSGNEAFMLSRTLQINGLMKKPIHLPDRTTMYMGTLKANQIIFAGNKLNYAIKSAKLLESIDKLNAAKDSGNVKYNLIEAYLNLFSIDQNLKIVNKEILDIKTRLKETIQFKNQGLATENDVLRFKLQKAQAELSEINLENNRTIVNYTLCILIGQPEGSYLFVDSIGYISKIIPDLTALFNKALLGRKELVSFQYKNQLSDLEISKINGGKLPTLGLGVTGYYINPNSQLIPPKNSFLAPVIVGLNLSWHISNLYTSKHKIAEARIQKEKLHIAHQKAIDVVKIEVNKQYHNYLQSVKKIDVLRTSVQQAKENDRIMELKYQNQLATTTDRIDAQTMLYQSLINLSIARSNTVLAYCRLLKSTGSLNEHNIF